jgi:hypothetical protein
MTPKLKPPGTKRLKLKCDEPLSDFAFKFNLRRYTLEALAVLRKASAYPVDQLRAQTDKTFDTAAATEDGGAAGPDGALPPPTVPGQGGAAPVTIEAAVWVVKKMRFDLGWVVKEARA